MKYWKERKPESPNNKDKVVIYVPYLRFQPNNTKMSHKKIKCPIGYNKNIASKKCGV